MSPFLWYLLIGFCYSSIYALFFRKKNEEFIHLSIADRKKELVERGIYGEEHYDNGRTVIYPKDMQNQDVALTVLEQGLLIGGSQAILFMARFLFWPLFVLISIFALVRVVLKFLIFCITKLEDLVGRAIAWCEKKETELAINKSLEELNQFSRTGLDAAPLDEWYWVEQEARCGLDRKAARIKLERFIEKMKESA